MGLGGVLARWESLSPVKQKVVTLITILGCCMFGWGALVIPLTVIGLTAAIGLDPATIRWYREVVTRYHDEVEDDETEEIKPTEPFVVTHRSAVKFALMAQSRVGMLRPTEANRLVYETVLLRLFEEYHVRHNIRISLLGEALVSCFVHTPTYQRARDIVDYLGRDERPSLIR